MRVSGRKTTDPQRSLVVDSPIGLLSLVATDDGLVGVAWVSTPTPTSSSRLSGSEPSRAQQVLLESAAWLAEYFETHHAPSPPPRLSLAGTPFQIAVWRQLLKLPDGATTTYGEIAHRIRHPGASRAVGQAVGANPLPILIPCHRVLAAGGRLGGFSSGLWRKRWLLAHEGLTGASASTGGTGGASEERVPAHVGRPRWAC